MCLIEKYLPMIKPSDVNFENQLWHMTYVKIIYAFAVVSTWQS